MVIRRQCSFNQSAEFKELCKTFRKQVILRNTTSQRAHSGRRKDKDTQHWFVILLYAPRDNEKPQNTKYRL